MAFWINKYHPKTQFMLFLYQSLKITGIPVHVRYVYLLFSILLYLISDHQKLEREARICRLLKHPNIGMYGQ
jgi:hypothetical protein